MRPFTWADPPKDDWTTLNQGIRALVKKLVTRVGNGTWDSPLTLNGASVWVDGSGKLRLKTSAPANDTDGTVVGTQT